MEPTLRQLSQRLARLVLSSFWALSLLWSLPTAHALQGGARSIGHSNTLRIDFTKDDGPSVCSGVRIGTHYVLTAAQCFGEQGQWQFSFSTLGKTIQLRNSTSDPQSFTIKAIHIHPDLMDKELAIKSSARSDLAILELVEPLHGVEASPLAFGPVGLQTHVVMGGFGKDRLKGAHSPTLQMVSGTFKNVGAHKLLLQASREAFLLDGDTGGPVYDMFGNVLAINSTLADARADRRIATEEIPPPQSWATSLHGQRTWVMTVIEHQTPPSYEP